MTPTRDPSQLPPFEKLGAFYLGRLYDAESGAPRPDLLLYDAKDLTTHAVCVGMTGSGKTGLCIALLEEAALDGIPAIAIDPKGDLGNLLLTFPELRPADFRPWIDEAEAARKTQTPDDFAAATAEKWRTGLAEWGQDTARIARLRDAADFAIYTPGSTAGLPISVLQSFAAPPPALAEDADAFRERVTATVSGLLALLGIEADPIQSREHILVSTLLDRAWRAGRDMNVAALIGELQSPPVDKIGVVDVETFFPAKDRTALAMQLNNLLASPGFAGWMEGEPLDVARLLWTPAGRPRVAILSIAHLSEAERMFFVTLLLNEVVAWMRGQSGTSSLRALLYMDEVFGYFPPVANPPSKTPMLTILKQARAYGLGAVLATQNPVDLDYKGLSNAGTWFLGRLQTERDKMRVLEGLEGASAAAGAAFDRQRMERILAGLGSRVFLMNNVHEDAPVLFHTRWAMSYLRGPLTRVQIQTLMAHRPAAAPAPAGPASASGAHADSAPRTAPPSRAGPIEGGERPVLPPSVPQTFLTVAGRSSSEAVVYRPALIGTAEAHYANASAGIDEWATVTCLADLSHGATGDVWAQAEVLDGEPSLGAAPEPGAAFAPLPTPASRATSYAAWEKRFKSHLYKNHPLRLWRCRRLKLVSPPGETEGEFRVRVRDAARERRDGAVEKLRARYAPKVARLEERIRKAEQRLAREQDQYAHQKVQTAISVGATVLGALIGRKAASVGTIGRATTAMRGAGRAARERGDIARVEQDLEAHKAELAHLEAEFEAAAAAVRAESDPEAYEIEEFTLRLKKADFALGRLALAWVPWWIAADGAATPAWE